jgi:carboxymethylenebutenolidase
MANGAMTSEYVTLHTDDGAEVDAYYARPAGEGPFPGVVVIQHILGVDEWIMEVCRRFAHHGYAAVAPNLYARIGGLEGNELDELVASLRSKGGLNDDLVMNDVKASMAFLRSRAECSGRVGAIGFCMGGRFVYLAAGKLEGLDAGVDCWGGGVAPAEGQANRPAVAAVDFTSNITAPILGIFGNDDSSPNVDEVNRTEAALKQHGKQYEFHRYDGAGHAFWVWGRVSYRREQANDAWDQTWAFLAKHLAPVAAAVG